MKFGKDMLPKVAQGVVAYLVGQKGEGASVLALEGDLGAGKTTLVQHIARVLGVAENPPSPTFVIMRRYCAKEGSGFSELVHIDAYRIEGESELPPLRLAEVFAKKDALVCVEWPQKLLSAVPKSATTIRLTTAAEEERELTSTPELEDYLQNYIAVV